MRVLDREYVTNSPAAMIAASAGNHAQGVAFAAKAYGGKAVIVMPTTTPLIKVNRTKALGAEVILYGDVYDESCEHAYQLAEENGYTFIHPFDDLMVAAGQGSIAMEIIKEQRSALYAVCLLALGYIFICALVIFNVEPETFPTFFDAVYWATVSLTTVGYGDIYPVSAAGRVISMLSSVFGIAIIALPAGIITAGFLDRIRKKKDD